MVKYTRRRKKYRRKSKRNRRKARRKSTRKNIQNRISYRQPKYLAGIYIPPQLYITPHTWNINGGLQFYKEPNIHYPITNNKKAQFYINAGMTTLYAFNQNDACVLFLKAAELDPQCQFAYAAASYAINMNINHTRVDKQLLQLAIDALKKAIKIKTKQPTKIKLWTEALIERTSISKNLDDPENLEPSLLETKIMMRKYCEKMKIIYKNYYDSEIAVLYAAAIMMTHPWRWWKRKASQSGLTTKDDINVLMINDTTSVLAILQDVLQENPRHVGANHYYIHATEEGPIPSMALGAAEIIVHLAQFGGHMQHMPSHVYANVGQYMHSIEVNMKAIKVDREYTRFMRRYHRQPNTFYFAEYMAHNPHFLIMSAMHLGNWGYCRRTIPILTSHVLKYIRLPNNSFLEHFLSVPILVPLRFQRFKQIIQYKIPVNIIKMLEQPHLGLRPHLVLTELYYAKTIAYSYLGNEKQAMNNYKKLIKYNKIYLSTKHRPLTQAIYAQYVKDLYAATTPDLEIDPFLLKSMINKITAKQNTHGDHDMHTHGSGHRSGGIVGPILGSGLEVKKELPGGYQGSIVVKNTYRVALLREFISGAIIKWNFGQHRIAISRMKAACKVYKNLYYDEPRSFYYCPYETLSSFMFQMGKYHECIKYAHLTLDIFPRTVRAIYCLQKAYVALGNKDELGRLNATYKDAMEHVDIKLNIKYI